MNNKKIKIFFYVALLILPTMECSHFAKKSFSFTNSGSELSNSTKVDQNDKNHIGIEAEIVETPKYDGIISDEEFYTLSEDKTASQQEELAEQHTLMRISPQMDAADGIINGFVLAKQENDEFVFYIFVDEDWKNKLAYTNILWGDDFTDVNNLHIRPFNFQNSTKGIYIDKLTYDVDWFETQPIAGGIAVGEINQQILNKILNEEDITETFMYVR